MATMPPPNVPEELAEYIHKRIHEANPGRDPNFLLIIVEEGAPPRMESNLDPISCLDVLLFCAMNSRSATVDARVVDTTEQ